MAKKRKIILGIFIGGILLIAVLATAYFWLLPRTFSSLFSPKAAPLTKENYQNPFAKPTQAYENPFSTYQNPFENLK